MWATVYPALVVNGLMCSSIDSIFLSQLSHISETIDAVLTNSWFSETGLIEPHSPATSPHKQFM